MTFALLGVVTGGGLRISPGWESGCVRGGGIDTEEMSVLTIPSKAPKSDPNPSSNVDVGGI